MRNNMKTKDRILATSLALFNQRGTSQVSTLDISTELNISPGNLYYHFQGKEAITLHLFEEFEEACRRVACAFESQVSDAEDYWSYLHTLLAVFAHYRFILRDSEHLQFGSEPLKRRLHRLLKSLKQLSLQMLRHLRQIGAIALKDEPLAILSDNVLLVAISWLNYSALTRGEQSIDEQVREGVCRLIALVLPYIVEQKQLFDDPALLARVLIQHR